MNSRDILEQRKLLLQKQMENVLEESRAKKQALETATLSLSMEKFVKPSVSEILSSSDHYISQAPSKTVHNKTKPVFVAKKAHPTNIKPANCPGTKEFLEKLPGKVPIKFPTCVFWDGATVERKFTLHRQVCLDDKLVVLLDAVKKSYAPLACVLSEKLMLAKEDCIIPLDDNHAHLTVRDLAYKGLFTINSPESMIDNGKPLWVIPRSVYQERSSSHPLNKWKLFSIG